MSDSDRSHHNLLTGLVLGVVAGAGLYYFFTKTDKGKQIKKVIEKKGKETLGELEDLIGQIEEKGKEFKTQAQKVHKRLENELSSGVKKDLSPIKNPGQGNKKTSKFFTRNGKTLK